MTSISGLLADYKAAGEEVWSLSWPETSIQSIDLEGLITCVVQRPFANKGLDGEPYANTLELKEGGSLSIDAGYIVAGGTENT